MLPGQRIDRDKDSRPFSFCRKKLTKLFNFQRSSCFVVRVGVFLRAPHCTNCKPVLVGLLWECLPVCLAQCVCAALLQIVNVQSGSCMLAAGRSGAKRLKTRGNAQSSILSSISFVVGGSEVDWGRCWGSEGGTMQRSSVVFRSQNNEREEKAKVKGGVLEEWCRERAW